MDQVRFNLGNLGILESTQKYLWMTREYSRMTQEYLGDSGRVQDMSYI